MDDSGNDKLGSVPIFGRQEPVVAYIDRQAAYAVILRDGNVTAVKSEISGNYFLPGGGAAVGESPEATVLREITEELGSAGRLTGYIGKAIQFFYAAVEDKHYRMEASFFTAELPAEETNDAVIDQSGKGVSGKESLCWLPVEEAQVSLFHACHVWTVEAAVGR